MLTPVDVQNKVFKGGIGYDKKDVEAFMHELTTDYEQLYRSNVELKDKVATLTESLQHYRSTEDSLQKALTLSEKTAEETIIAAKDKARQIINESTKKAEALLADSQQELRDTKAEISQLKQLYTKFKAQYTRILEGQLQLIGENVVDIDLGEGYDMNSVNNAGFTYGESGLGSLGEGGGYTSSSSFDDRFERTNQEPAFDRGALNMDPFADAANGGGRFSKHTGKGFTGSSTGSSSGGSSTETKSSLNVKNTKSSSPKVRKNFSSTVNSQSENVSATVNTESYHFTAEKADVDKYSASDAKPMSNAAVSSDNSAENTDSKKEKMAMETAMPTETAVNDTEKTSVASQPVFPEDDGIMSGEVEKHVEESSLIGNDDDDDDGFSFINADTAKESVLAEEPNYSEDDGAVSGEVEQQAAQSNMLDSEDNYDVGFDFVDDEKVDNLFDDSDNLFSESDNSFSEPENSFNDSDNSFSEPENIAFSSSESIMNEDTTYSGEVEDKVNNATMLESEDNVDEGLFFVVGDDSEEEIPTISPGGTLNINFDSFSSNQEENDDVFAGDVEEPVNQSNLIGNADDESEGFSFL